MKTQVLLVACIVSATSTVACSKEKKAEAPTTAADSGKNDFPNKDPNAGSIRLDPALAKLCDMPAAHFEFDSAKLSTDANAALDALAACFTIGAAKDRGMRIIGFADPRGETEYNYALGQRRAGTVEEFLVVRKVGKNRIESSSRGELDAKGTDEAGWAQDRRVEISLAE